MEKIFVMKEENLKTFEKTCRDPYLGLDLPMRVNKKPIHLVAQSLSEKSSNCDRGISGVNFTFATVLLLHTNLALACTF
jgi:hypothetical protein